MKNYYLICLLIFFISINFSFGQKHTILGFVYDKHGLQPVQDIIVSIKGNKEAVTLTDSLGHYRFENILIDSSLSIRYNHPLYNVKTETLSETQNKIISLVTFLEEKEIPDTNLIKAVEKASVIYIPSEKKLVFYTDALNLNENSTIDDFISSLPVITEVDGKYWFEGENIITFSIDGNSFFSSNNDVILKNIPAAFIERAEVYEAKSTKNSLTGFDDSGYEKTIDLYSNPEYRNSLFGRIYTGISNVERWNTGGNLNFFNGPRVVSIIHETNNINVKNYTGLNLTNLEGASNLSAFENRSSSEINTHFSDFFGSYQDFVIDQSNGINENLMFGVTYFEQFKKWKVHGEYFFDKTDNKTEAEFKRIYFGTSTDSLTYYEKSDVESSNLSHRMNFNATYQFDELQKIKMSSIIFIQGIHANSNLQGQYLNPVSTTSDTLGKANNINQFSANAYQISFPIIYQKKFRSNSQRTLLVKLTPNYYSEDKTGYLNSEYSMIYGPKLPVNNFLLDNTTEYKKENLNSEVAYSEPITDHFSLLFSWKFNFDNNKYQIKTDSLLSFVTLNDSTVSVNMTQRELTNFYGLFYKLEWEKLKITQGFQFEQLNFDIEKKPSSIISSSNLYNYLLPSLFVEYTPNRQNMFRLLYERNISAPNIQSTRDVLTVDNPLNLEKGNMFLTPSTIDFFSAKYLYANKDATQYFQAYLSASFIKDYIGLNTIQGEQANHFNTFSGYKIVGFENLSNYYALNSFFNFNTPIKFISSSLDIFLQSTYNNVPSVYNEEKFYTKENMDRFGISLKSEFRNDIHFIISSHSSYHHVNTTLTSNPTEYFIQNFILSFQSTFFNRLIISSDIDNQLHFGISKNYENTYYTVWNASLGYKFLRDRSMEFRFSIHDILNQNRNIIYSVTDAYVEVLRTNNLKRYFMFTLTYHLKATNLKIMDNF